MIPGPDVAEAPRFRQQSMFETNEMNSWPISTCVWKRSCNLLIMAYVVFDLCSWRFHTKMHVPWFLSKKMVGRHRHSQIRIVILLPTCTKNWCRLLGRTWLYPCKAYTITKLKHEQSQTCPHSNLTKYSATAWYVTSPRNNFTNGAAELWAATTPVGLSSRPASRTKQESRNSRILFPISCRDTKHNFPLVPLEEANCHGYMSTGPT